MEVGLHGNLSGVGSFVNTVVAQPFHALMKLH